MSDYDDGEDSNIPKGPIKIPSFAEVAKAYDEKWGEEKEKFQRKLSENFEQAVRAFRSGKVEVYELTETPYSKHYIQAFRDLFSDTGYQASCGELEKLGASGGKRVRRLFITLPPCYR